MLSLTRRIGEKLVITAGDDQITVEVIGINGNQVRLATSAPKHIAVHREEIARRIEAGKATTA